MKQPLVSVIVPIYGVEQYLQHCIDSICNQTYDQLEIILIDDGSPDSCGLICDRYSHSDPRITVIHKENGGLSSARNAGLNIATGLYVAMVDSDDTIHPQFIEILVGLCEKYQCDIAQCDFLTVCEQSLKLPLNPQGSLVFYTGKQALHELCVGQRNVKYVVAWNKIYRRNLFHGIRYPLKKIHEDEFTTYQILWKAQKMVVTNQYLYYYLQRSESITGKKYSIKRLDALDAFRERINFLKENGLEDEYFATIKKYLVLIEKNYVLLKENEESCDAVCDALLKEKKQLEIQLSSTLISEEQMLPVNWTVDTCPYPKHAKLVLYGAGKRGCACYQWIYENCWGTIVGWVDNSWNEIRNTDYPVMPLDALLTMSYDYVLITIQNKNMQEEVSQNLISWGIPEGKVLVV